MEPAIPTITTNAALSVRLIHFLERQPGWRLWLGFSLACLVAVEVIVSLMDLLLNGAVTWDYLLTGLVAAGLVAPVSLAGLTYLLETTRQAKADALELQNLRAGKNMQVGSWIWPAAGWPLTTAACTGLVLNHPKRCTQ